MTHVPADRADAIRRMPSQSWQRCHALGEPESAADVLTMLTDARRSYWHAFDAWRPMSPLDPGYREAKDLADTTARETSALMHIADALGATVAEVNAALAAAEVQQQADTAAESDGFGPEIADRAL
jgi:hypothetical protein